MTGNKERDIVSSRQFGPCTRCRVGKTRERDHVATMEECRNLIESGSETDTGKASQSAVLDARDGAINGWLVVL